MPYHFHSLRVRLLLPLLAVALLASIAVAVGSYLLGDKWAKEETVERYRDIEATLSGATFPLTRPVIESLATLTDTELTALSESGRVVATSLDAGDVSTLSRILESKTPMQDVVEIGGRTYRFAETSRNRASNDPSAKVVVFFDEGRLRSTRMRAASLPLLTGLSTVVLLTSVTLVMTNHLIRRLSRLQVRVNEIASGDFDADLPIGASDEVGMLAISVQRMSDQLKRMWASLQRQQGQKLLHQLAGGLAHQLRNSITGARMAIELHHRECDAQGDSLEVAISQLEQTEAQVRRLLIAASGRREADQPQVVGDCLRDVQRTLSATARHLHVELSWQMDDEVDQWRVADGPSLHAAVANLVLNAMQAAAKVQVAVRCGPDPLTVTVVDNGPGPPESVADEIFEPFVTSKPEGLGLGLPLVMESAKRLGGQVSWERHQDQTRFTITAQRLIPLQQDGSF